MTVANPRRDRGSIVFLIGLFRLFKALLLLAAGGSALGLMRPDTAQRMRQWLTTFPYAGDHSWLQHLIGAVTGMDERHALIVAIAAFSYAALFIVEGTGLILGRAWAEWMTVIATASFIPFEGYELVHRATAPRAIILVLNAAILIYLAWRIRLRRAAGPSSHPR
jgi:uncharacterized membrane protein (DUF2068 family)